jgi:hypothetical protein
MMEEIQQEKITLTLPNDFSTVRFMDITGRMIMNMNYEKDASPLALEIGNELNAGIYFIEVANNSVKVVKKIINE